jgi:hypothetical protein
MSANVSFGSGDEAAIKNVMAAYPERIRFGGSTRTISQVTRDFLNVNLMSPRRKAEARARNDTDSGFSHPPAT